MYRSALLVLSGNAMVAVLFLARSLVIARLIPVADYGIAATFALAMANLETLESKDVLLGNNSISNNNSSQVSSSSSSP